MKEPSEAAGAPNPIPDNPIPITFPNIKDPGMRRSRDDIILLIKENVVCPAPINKPFKQKTNGTII